jgi:hypothetical protein
VCVGNTAEVTLVRCGALRVQIATDGGAQSAEKGPSPTALGRERRLMVKIGVRMGWMETRAEGSLCASERGTVGNAG